MIGAESPSAGGLFHASVFHVCLHGSGLALAVGGCWQSVGFYKNEAVLAPSADQAIQTAVERVHGRLTVGSNEFQVDWDIFSINVESVQVDFRVWRLFERQGFVFYPIEESLSSSA